MRTPRPGGRDTGPVWERPALLLLGVVAVAAGVLWAAGEISGRIVSGGWPHVRPVEMGGVLARIARTPGDPAAAFPAVAARRIPGPAAFWASAAGILATLAGTVFRLVGRLRPERDDTPARWATRRDLRALLVRGARRGRIVLGRSRHGLVAAEPGMSLLVVGPTRTGKTSGLAVPAILEWEGPVVAASIKSELASLTAGWRERRGPVWVYDPSGQSGLPAAGWSPLSAAGTWGEAQRVAEWLGVAARPATAGLQDAGFWNAAAAKLLAPLLFAAASSGRQMADVVRWLDTQEQAEVLLALSEAGVDPAEAAAVASFRREERQRSGIYTTAETILSCFSDPAVAASAARADIDPHALLGRAGTLYLCAPAHEQRRLRPLFVALLEQVLAAAFEQAVSAPLDPPLLVVLDEAAHIAPLPDLDGLAATAAGHGIQLVTVFHDLAQVTARYGHRASSVVNNHRARLVLSGIADPETLRRLSGLAGDVEVTTPSVTRDASGRRSLTESATRRPLLSPADLRAVRPGRGVLLYGHLPPVRIALRPWFRDHALRRLTHLPPAVRGSGTGQDDATTDAEAAAPVVAPGTATHAPGPADADRAPSAEPGTLARRVARGAPEPETSVGPAVAARLLGISRPGVYDLWERGALPVVEVWEPGRGMRPRVPLGAIADRLSVPLDELRRRL